MPEERRSAEETQVNLSNCAREPIHILGQVQNYGCLIAVSSDWSISHASENCRTVIGHDASELIGRQLAEILPETAIHHLRTQMQVLAKNSGAARIFAYKVFGDEQAFDISIHIAEGFFLLEFERRTDATRHYDDPALVQSLIARIRQFDTVERMAQEATRGLKALSGFDRVMVYRFEEDYSGTVIAEATQPGLEPYLGLRYPASDIPEQARKLYTKSVLRIICDVDGQTHAIVPPSDPDGNPLDLSLAVTRAVSPIHLEYLRNMGVQASMSVSIIRNGELWGLFACHHRSPRYIDYEKRSAVELFAQLFNYELAQLEMSRELADLDRARELHDQLLLTLSSGFSIAEAFDSLTGKIRDVIPFDGAAIYSKGVYRAIGAAPTEEEFVGLARFLNTVQASEVYATENLVTRYPAAEEFGDRVAGILALPISRGPRDYLVLFRREIAKSVNWAGNPEKPFEIGPNDARLTPRRSFEAWKEVVRNHSAPWKAGERRAAEALRVTLLEVVLKLADESNALRKKAQDQQELLIAELNHRVRNILNLIRGLVSQGSDEAESLDAYRDVLDARIHALARAHDQLTSSEWDWVPLRSLIETEVGGFISSASDRVHIAGDAVDLSPEAFTAMALVIHELATNAAKYGALSNTSGSVRVDIRVSTEGTAHLAWRERNGPPVKAPTRRGFGTTIIDRSIPFELNGTAEVWYRTTGLEAEFTLPGRHVRRSTDITSSGAPEPTPPAQDVRLSGAAMVLEDNLIIALDAADMLTGLGASNVRTASRVADALRILEKSDVSFALVDVNLGNELSLPVVELCQQKGIPVLLATGYGASDDLTRRFPGVVILRKPYTLDHLKAALAETLGSSEPE